MPLLVNLESLTDSQIRQWTVPKHCEVQWKYKKLIGHYCDVTGDSLSLWDYMGRDDLPVLPISDPTGIYGAGPLHLLPSPSLISNETKRSKQHCTSNSVCTQGKAQPGAINEEDWADWVKYSDIPLGESKFEIRNNSDQTEHSKYHVGNREHSDAYVEMLTHCKSMLTTLTRRWRYIFTGFYRNIMWK